MECKDWVWFLRVLREDVGWRERGQARVVGTGRRRRQERRCCCSRSSLDHCLLQPLDILLFPTTYIFLFFFTIYHSSVFPLLSLLFFFPLPIHSTVILLPFWILNLSPRLPPLPIPPNVPPSFLRLQATHHTTHPSLC